MELFVSALVSYLVIIDPPGCVPIFASLTEGAPDAHRKRMAVRSILVAGGIILFFALVGGPLLAVLGISLDAFRIAGGIMLFLIALEMVFERRTKRREERAASVAAAAAEKDHPEWEDISVFPMGIPMITGPGTIATTLLMVTRTESVLDLLIVLGAIAIVLAITLAMLLVAIPLLRFAGPQIEAVVTRILGVILAALAAQFVIDGIRASVGAVG